MNKLPIALLVSAMAVSTGILAAERDSQTSQATPEDCSKLSGKEKDKCIQATPAGPVDTQTGAQRKGKSEIAKDRDRAKEENQGEANAPAQANDTVGRPAERSATGEAGAKDSTSAGNTPPEQSKDTVGHPDERRTTGEAQSGQEPGENVARKTQ